MITAHKKNHAKRISGSTKLNIALQAIRQNKLFPRFQSILIAAEQPFTSSKTKHWMRLTKYLSRMTKRCCFIFPSRSHSFMNLQLHCVLFANPAIETSNFIFKPCTIITYHWEGYSILLITRQIMQNRSIKGFGPEISIIDSAKGLTKGFEEA